MEVKYRCKKCRKDITDLVAKVPWDGKDYPVKCPDCGTEHRIMRTPPAPAEVPQS